MGHFQRRDQERLSRKQAAERLTDLAYALTAGAGVELSLNGEWIKVAVPEHLLLERDVRSNGGRIELSLGLSWPTGDSALR